MKLAEIKTEFIHVFILLVLKRIPMPLFGSMYLYNFQQTMFNCLDSIIDYFDWFILPANVDRFYQSSTINNTWSLGFKTSILLSPTICVFGCWELFSISCCNGKISDLNPICCWEYWFALIDYIFVFVLVGPSPLDVFIN